MPTPVTTARHCLASDTARALDDAVSVASRRAHAQTTSLHVVSALLSSPSTPAAQIPSLTSSSSSTSSSILRDALSRARSVAYSPRLQLKALELCFGVALDRLPSHGPSPPEEPAVSNSLMAAIKRSQANQRRNPDTFHLYQQQQQQQQQSTSGFSGVKVELQQLILAILDDPVVSRVFGEAGFRSCDIKLAVLRPPPPPPSLLRFPRAAARCPPLFLCNLSPDGISSLPFTDGEENSRRIAEVLARKFGCRNPILVGAGAAEAANEFARAVEQQNSTVIPPDIRGMKLISVENDVAGGSWDEKTAEEIRRQAKIEPGVLVSVGDLKRLAEKENADSPSGTDGDVVAKLTSLLENNGERLHVLGWSATYETYLKMLSKYPSLDREWDLQLLPISYVKSGSSAGWLSRPRSSMESFIPFGGFFPTTHEPKYILKSPPKAASYCKQCDNRFEQELPTPFGTQLQTNLPSWMHISETNSTKSALDAGKAKYDNKVLHGKVLDLKWNEKHLHHNILFFENDRSRMMPQTFEPYATSREGSGDKSCRSTDLNQSQENEIPISIGLQIPSANQSISMPIIIGPKDENFKKLHSRPSKSEQLQRMGSCRSFISAGVPEEVASPSSMTSVTTDLALGTPCETPRKVEKSSSPIQTEILPSQNIDALRDTPELKSYACTDINSGKKGGSLALSSLKDQSMYSSSSGPWTSCTMTDQCDPRGYKALIGSLIEKVDWQKEAIRTISQAIAQSEVKQEKRRGAKLSLHFCGPDEVGKRRIAQALAEFVYGSKENFICIDLSFQDLSNSPATICDQAISKSAVTSRGKTSTDYIVGELSKKPWSVVLLENLDKADVLVQNSLSNAIRTGKFSDSHGREFSINNNIFVTTSNLDHSWTWSSEKCRSYFPEERILRTKSRQMMISIEPASNVASNCPNVKTYVTLMKESASRQTFQCSNHLNKRKLDVTAYSTGDETLGTLKRAQKSLNTFLDLNMPFEESVTDDADSSTDENNFTSENPETWLEEYIELVDENVTFKPFDFDALADKVLEEIRKICQGSSGTSTIEIDTECMDQILAATWLLEDRGALNKWLERVLCRSFIDVQQRYKLSSNTALRLVICEDVPLEDLDPQIALPSKIIVN